MKERAQNNNFLKRGHNALDYISPVYIEVEVKLHVFLNLAVDGGECSGSFSGHLSPKKEPPLLPIE
jgi:hypothetical protein